MSCLCSTFTYRGQPFCRPGGGGLGLVLSSRNKEQAPQQRASACIRTLLLRWRRCRAHAVSARRANGSRLKRHIMMGYEYRTDVSFRLRHQTGSERKKVWRKGELTGVRPVGTVVAGEPFYLHMYSNQVKRLTPLAAWRLFHPETTADVK